ncbi:protocatechuate dioxygenase [Nonomuraea sp. PA05]|uniref:dioxygenase family protein n=1 Tax=Nonomuraea sp. PA05 TaxID=2604466 RepID=UPI0011D76649|nr:protocatechuate dioxygenase [Nonomuraea sp. PA05]TYB66093.1 protocatechuate dioxygenase [Nonomuraea sp. PA05]
MGHDHEGRRVSRRRMITGVGSLGLGGLFTAGAHATSEPDTYAKADALFAEARTCSLAPSAQQGPYYFETRALRSDLREDREGVRLRLAIKVQDGRTCRPLPGSVVEIWHCDAAGLYSGAEAESRDALSSGGKISISAGEKFTDMRPSDRRRYLRGAQVADGDGIVRFTTVWPGWYPGRTVHVHVMVVVGGDRALCTELMFDEAYNRKVLALPPYQGHDQPRDTFNGNDPIYKEGMLTQVTADGDGYLAVIVLSAGPDS